MNAGPALSAEEFRELDRRASREFGIPVSVLMENAGKCAAEEALKFLRKGGVKKPGRILVLAGGGNNGGDGLAAARILKEAGWDVGVLLLKPAASLKGAAAENLKKLEGVEVLETPDASVLGAEIKKAVLVIDALLGTGFKGPMAPAFADAIRGVNASGKPVLSLDIPSGMDADSGDPGDICVRADRTVTMHALKKGFLAPGAKKWTGEITVAAIGFPEALIKRDRGV